MERQHLNRENLLESLITPPRKRLISIIGLVCYVALALLAQKATAYVAISVYSPKTLTWEVSMLR